MHSVTRVFEALSARPRPVIFTRHPWPTSTLRSASLLLGGEEEDEESVVFQAFNSQSGRDRGAIASMLPFEARHLRRRFATDAKLCRASRAGASMFEGEEASAASTYKDAGGSENSSTNRFFEQGVIL